MIIWTTAGLFSLVEEQNPDYVKIEARCKDEIDALTSTLRLVDINIDTTYVTEDGHGIILAKEDASEWLQFEMDHWIGEPLGRQFVKVGDMRSAIAYEQLLMNLEK